MDINLPNYNKSLISKQIKNTSSRKINEVFINYFDYEITDVINIIKKSILSPHPNYKVNVIFENFSNLTSIMFETKKLFHNLLIKTKLTNSPFLDTAWSDDFKNTIHITKNIYKRDTSFTEYLGNTL